MTRPEHPKRSFGPYCGEDLKRADTDDERGAVAVIVALLMVVLPGFTAIVIDVAAMYWEKAQLQNGADAAALGIAQQCAAGECGDISTTATTLAGLNANDGKASAIPAVAGDSVTVTTSTLTAGGENELAHLFAPVLGIDSSEIGARATAGWGSPSSGPAILPMAISHCNFPLGLAAGRQLIRYDTTVT